MSSEFEIKRLLEITKTDKYAATVAAFEIVDLIEQIGTPKNFETRKPSIKAMQIMSEKNVKYDFIDDEKRNELYDELGDGSEYETQVQAAPAADLANQIFAPMPGDEPADEEDQISEVVADSSEDAPVAESESKEDASEIEEDNDDTTEDTDQE